MAWKNVASFFHQDKNISPFGAGVNQTLAAHSRRSIPWALVAGLGTLDYGCEDRYAADSAVAFGLAAGLGRKAILS
jgi:hypothetical protein